jgi:chromosome segregation ATPase
MHSISMSFHLQNISLQHYYYRSVTRAELNTASDLQHSREGEENRLKSTFVSMETKCSRLREYIKKLTKKCEEWEVSYEKQARCIEELQVKNLKIREKASEFGSRYKKLKGEIQQKKKSHRDDREKWTCERSTLHEVHAQLEEELELIAKELDS